MIVERREVLKNDPSQNSRGDLLTIMLNDSLFQNSDDQIINESVTFFLAGTLTQATTIANALCYLIQNPRINQRVRESLEQNFPSFADKNQPLEKLGEELTIDSLDLSKDDYLKLVIYETLRKDTPV